MLNYAIRYHKWMHKDDTDMLDLQAVANDFVSHNSSRIWNICLMHTAQNVHFSVILICIVLS